jgi:hypothetical protein
MFKKSVPTVAAALAAFQKPLADLRAVKEHHDAEAAKQSAAIVKATAATDKAVEAAKQAVVKAEEAAQNAINKALQLREAAEAEARAAVQSIARFEALLGL